MYKRQRPDIQNWSDSPVLILHGDADDWTPLHLVEGLMPQLPNANLHIYQGAHHSFDCQYELTYLPKADRLRKLTARINKNGRISGKLFQGIPVPLNKRWQRKWILRILRNRGAHVEGDPVARADSLVRGKEFFIKYILLPLQDNTFLLFFDFSDLKRQKFRVANVVGLIPGNENEDEYLSLIHI